MSHLSLLFEMTLKLLFGSCHFIDFFSCRFQNCEGEGKRENKIKSFCAAKQCRGRLK